MPTLDALARPGRLALLARLVVCAALASLAAQAAQAAQSTRATTSGTLVTFDERPWVLGPDEYAFYSNPLNGEYDSLGVDFGIAYLQPADPYSNFSDSQFLLGPNGYGITFTHPALPTFVSLAFSSPLYEYRATVSAWGTDGLRIGSADTGGHYLDDGANWVTSPYNPASFAAFYSEHGIARLTFNTMTGPRLEAKLDNLYFGNSAPAVPEPTTIVMWGSGLLALAMGLRGVIGTRPTRPAPPRATRKPAP